MSRHGTGRRAGACPSNFSQIADLFLRHLNEDYRMSRDTPIAMSGGATDFECYRRHWYSLPLFTYSLQLKYDDDANKHFAISSSLCLPHLFFCCHRSCSSRFLRIWTTKQY